MIEYPRRVRGVASSIGFSQPTVRGIGDGDNLLEFNLPERPPVTYPPEKPSQLILNLVAGTSEPGVVTQYELGETVVRFPYAREEDFPIATVRIAATVGLSNVGYYPSGRLRIDQSNGGYAVEYRIPRNEMLEIDRNKFLRGTSTARNDFHNELAEVY